MITYVLEVVSLYCVCVCVYWKCHQASFAISVFGGVHWELEIDHGEIRKCHQSEPDF